MTHTDTPVARALAFLERRTGLAGAVRSQVRYVFPRHFSFMWGEVALYSFVVLFLTGTFLALFYVPSEARVTYAGSYSPLSGVEVTEAYHSVVDLSFDVRAGLLARQVHHWAALVFTAAIVVHLSRVFFTGAFRKPRELQWLSGVALLALSFLEGFLGYSLLDDLLSGTGLRIAHAVVESVPVVGPQLAVLLWGGSYPGQGLLGRLFVLHILVVPLLISGLIALHLALVARQHHTQFPGPGRDERNVVGLRAWPTYATKSVALLFAVCAVLAVMGGFVQINPVWLYGPYDAFVVTSGAQADFYVLWTQGALRLMPGVEWRIGTVTVANQLIPALAFPVLVFALLAAYPWLERRVTGDDAEHHLLERPRDRPVRTGLGAGALTGFALLLLAGSDDVLATTADLNLVWLRWTERVALVVLPPLVGWAAASYASALKRQETSSS